MAGWAEGAWLHTPPPFARSDLLRSACGRNISVDDPPARVALATLLMETSRLCNSAIRVQTSAGGDAGGGQRTGPRGKTAPERSTPPMPRWAGLSVKAQRTCRAHGTQQRSAHCASLEERTTLQVAQEISGTERAAYAPRRDRTISYMHMLFMYVMYVHAHVHVHVHVHAHVHVHVGIYFVWM